MKRAYLRMSVRSLTYLGALASVILMYLEPLEVYPFVVMLLWAIGMAVANAMVDIEDKRSKKKEVDHIKELHQQLDEHLTRVNLMKGEVNPYQIDNH